jgi:putative hydrolase of the HAD superfamily
MIKALFIDIGGVILTNGWDRQLRERAAEHFQIEKKEMDERHHLTFEVYELGFISLDEYLKRVVFFQPRNFSIEDFKEYMFTQAKSFSEMLQLIDDFKKQFGLKVVAMTNEGRELMEDRIRRFELKKIIDYFCCSSFMHLRKPNEEMYRMAIDFVQNKLEEIAYLDDRLLLVEIGQKIGLNAIQHIDYEKTKMSLSQMLEKD